MDFSNPSVRNGVICGLILVAYNLVLYIAGPRMIFSWMAWLSLVIYVVFMVRSVREAREGESEFSFKQALKPSFITYLVASLMAMIFSYVLFNFIDPGLMDIQREKTMEMVEWMARFGGEDAVEAALEKVEGDDFSFGPLKAIQAYALGLIFPGFIIAAIISLIMRRKPVES